MVTLASVKMFAAILKPRINLNANKDMKNPPKNIPIPTKAMGPRLTINKTMQIAKIAGNPAKTAEKIRQIQF